jgi:hypothetical protein
MQSDLQGHVLQAPVVGHVVQLPAVLHLQRTHPAHSWLPGCKGWQPQQRLRAELGTSALSGKFSAARWAGRAVRLFVDMLFCIVCASRVFLSRPWHKVSIEAYDPCWVIDATPQAASVAPVEAQLQATSLPTATAVSPEGQRFWDQWLDALPDRTADHEASQPRPNAHLLQTSMQFPPPAWHNCPRWLLWRFQLSTARCLSKRSANHLLEPTCPS